LFLCAEDKNWSAGADREAPLWQGRRYCHKSLRQPEKGAQCNDKSGDC